MRVLEIKSVNQSCDDGIFESNSSIMNVMRKDIDLSWVCDEDRKEILSRYREWAITEYGEGPNLDYGLFDFEAFYLDIYNDTDYMHTVKNKPTFDEYLEEYSDDTFDEYLESIGELDSCIESAVDSFIEEEGYDLANLNLFAVSGYQSGIHNFWEDECDGYILRDKEAYDLTFDFKFEDSETKSDFFEALSEADSVVDKEGIERLITVAIKKMYRRGKIDWEFWDNIRRNYWL